MATEIRIFGDVPKNATVVEGFPSKGFVSTIAAKYLIDELEMDVVGYIKSDRIQSIAVVHDSKPMHPMRIYRKDDIIVLFSEMTIPLPYIKEFSEAFRKWFREIQPSKVILMAGISGRETDKEHEIFGLATTEELQRKIESLNVEKIEEGMIAGVSSDILLNCIEDGIPVISLMVETMYSPDPLGAATLLGILNEILELNLDIQTLIKKGEEIEEEFKRITEELKKGKLAHRELDEYSPMYC
ncbi:MAG TPA: proteasome assembly chaperone family protein [Candidatus Altiarchaeales archaeon]|nr:MAG: hypothetical protein DRO65_00835 [Candidatus Altiarchaeales archaeon]HDN83789.1 proteasome assembly chaperone family protein [Candidatus Altiarchaeales archaeon]